MFCVVAAAVLASDKVTLQRVPDGGIQPQVVADGKGTVHLLYYNGDAKAGNLFYTKSSDDGKTFGEAIRVNSDPNSAIAVGNIRGAHIAIGKNGRVHVAWMGSDAAPQKGPKNEVGMLYTRLDDAGKAFEPQRNVIQQVYGLDGGGTVAADAQGNVYVLWHGGDPRKETERRVLVARSTDDGKTFQKETAPFAQNTGACGCCGMAAAADSKGNVYALYRSASGGTRDMYLIMSRDKGATFQGGKVADWRVATCPMSACSFTETVGGMLAGWETDGQVYFCRIDASLKPGKPIAAPGDGRGRKFPVMAETKSETILVWTEGMGWQMGGNVAWQVFDKDGKPTAEKGESRGVPEWSLVAVFPRSDGGFTILH